VVAEKVDGAGRHVRQIELCERHAQVVIARERARPRDSGPPRLAVTASADGVVENPQVMKPRHAAALAQKNGLAQEGRPNASPLLPRSLFNSCVRYGTF